LVAHFKVVFSQLHLVASLINILINSEKLPELLRRLDQINLCRCKES